MILIGAQVDPEFKGALRSAAAYHECSESEFIRSALRGHLLAEWREALETGNRARRNFDSGLALLEQLRAADYFNQPHPAREVQSEEQLLDMLNDFDHRATEQLAKAEALYPLLVGMGLPENGLAEVVQETAKAS